MEDDQPFWVGDMVQRSMPVAALETDVREGGVYRVSYVIRNEVDGWMIGLTGICTGYPLWKAENFVLVNSNERLFEESVRRMAEECPRLNAHIKSEWTWPGHFAHDGYQRGHLPQLMIRASGWKARLLALVFRPSNSEVEDVK